MGNARHVQAAARTFSALPSLLVFEFEELKRPKSVSVLRFANDARTDADNDGCLMLPVFAPLSPPADASRWLRKLDNEVMDLFNSVFPFSRVTDRTLCSPDGAGDSRPSAKDSSATDRDTECVFASNSPNACSSSSSSGSGVGGNTNPPPGSPVFRNRGVLKPQSATRFPSFRNDNSPTHCVVFDPAFDPYPSILTTGRQTFKCLTPNVTNSFEFGNGFH